jgi:ribosomal protein L44E
MAKTSASDLRAIRAWQAANPDKVRKAHHKYEVAHYAERKAAKAAWAQRKRAGKAAGIGRAAGLRMLRESERAKNIAQLESF